jgi:hypothetical protein
LENQSGFTGFDSELQIYLSDDPKGFCLEDKVLVPAAEMLITIFKNLASYLWFF